MNREKLEKNIASNLTIDLDVAKFIEVTLLDIEKYANQKAIEELHKVCDGYMGDDIMSVEYIIQRIKELKQ
tara:strand:+ start:63 stop:275 length:213 start_codon:yes stop_codon:yes gene_type:complete